MCRPRSEGGAPCSAHTRPAYEAALAAVLRAKATTAPAALRALEDAALAYASTREGQARIPADAARAEARQLWETAGLLSTAVRRGAARLDMYADTERALRASRASSPAGTRSLDGTPPEPVSWSPRVPIWPRRDLIDDALTGAPAEQEALFRKAYRSVFSTQWRARFYRQSSAPVGPGSNEEGWAWREAATVATGKALRAATLSTLGKAQPGWVVFADGYGTRTVRAITQMGRDRFVDENGTTRTVKLVKVVYTDGRAWVGLREDLPVVVLPGDALELG